MAKPGDKFKANNERNRYTVMAADDRFAIMTKPFAAQKTYIYTITDVQRGVASPTRRQSYQLRAHHLR